MGWRDRPWLRGWVVLMVCIGVVVGGVVASGSESSGLASASGPALTHSTLAGVRVGESRAEVSRALGRGRDRSKLAQSALLGVCSGGLCRSYRVDGALLGVDFDRAERVIEVLTRSSSLIIDGHRAAAGYTALRAALRTWRPLACTDGGHMLIGPRATDGTVATLSFAGGPFLEADISAQPAPSGCATSSDTRTTTTNDPWWILETGPGSRSLVIGYRGAECATQPGRAQLGETGSEVRIGVVQRVLSHPAACTDVLQLGRVTVALRRPLAGRVVAGERLELTTLNGRPLDLPHPFDAVTYLLLARHFRALLPEVPRVIGLASTQVRYVLALQGFRSRISGHGRQITGQDPARSRVPKDSRACCSGFAGDVSLTAG
jgi:hypothetical protein